MGLLENLKLHVRLTVVNLHYISNRQLCFIVSKSVGKNVPFPTVLNVTSDK